MDLEERLWVKHLDSSSTDSQDFALAKAAPVVHIERTLKITNIRSLTPASSSKTDALVSVVAAPGNIASEQTIAPLSRSSPVSFARNNRFESNPIESEDTLDIEPEDFSFTNWLSQLESDLIEKENSLDIEPEDFQFTWNNRPDGSDPIENEDSRLLIEPEDFPLTWLSQLECDLENGDARYTESEDFPFTWNNRPERVLIENENSQDNIEPEDFPFTWLSPLEYDSIENDDSLDIEPEDFQFTVHSRLQNDLTENEDSLMDVEPEDCVSTEATPVACFKPTLKITNVHTLAPVSTSNQIEYVVRTFDDANINELREVSQLQGKRKLAKLDEKGLKLIKRKKESSAEEQEEEEERMSLNNNT